MLDFDLVIVGAGPSGLALAQCCSGDDKRILIIDSELSIGGCHRVRRVNYNNQLLFSEHGPRIYSETYTTFKALLKEMNIDFYSLFKKYKFNISEIGNETIFSVLSYTELGFFIKEFLFLIFDDSHGENVNLHSYLSKNNFTEKSIDMIDRVCRLTDGGDSKKFTLNEFLQLFNQQFFYSLHQPILPNDVGLFGMWYDWLVSHNVDFLLGTSLEKINYNLSKNEVESIIVYKDGYHQKINTKKLVLAIPPKSLYNLLIKQDNLLQGSFGELKNYSQETSYIEYISITFHWDTYLNLKKVYGFPRSDWGVAFIVLTDYMSFFEDSSRTVISAAVTIVDAKSKNNNKTANECDESEVIQEVFNQLKLAFGDDLLDPTISVLSPGVTYNNNTKKWESIDTAFILSNKYTSLNFKSNTLNNLYTLGTHNGKSLYKFTSLEAAVSNAVVLAKELCPTSKYTISRSYTVTDLLKVLVFIFVIYLAYLLLSSKHRNVKSRYRIK
jgi:uncharacterized protein YrzB (UPF0473 family)